MFLGVTLLTNLTYNVLYLSFFRIAKNVQMKPLTFDNRIIRTYINSFIFLFN